MPINQLYHTWIRQICELQPKARITQIRNFVWLMLGIYRSRSVHLSKIAGEVPGTAKLLSIARRLHRFVDNPAIRVREWYEPIARQWLQAQWRCLGEIRLIVDGTKVGFGHRWAGLISLFYIKNIIITTKRQVNPLQSQEFVSITTRRVKDGLVLYFLRFEL